jgi:hypothetical protein
MSLREAWACYLDLDGTLLGRGASLLHDGEGSISLLGVRAIEALLRAGVEVVLMSGRRRGAVAEDARLFGQTSFIYEAGCVLVLDSEEQWLTDGLLPGERSVHEQIAAGARSRTCSADSSTRAKQTSCCAPVVTGACGSSTTASCTAAPRRWPAFRRSAATT